MKEEESEKEMELNAKERESNYKDTELIFIAFFLHESFVPF